MDKKNTLEGGFYNGHIKGQLYVLFKSEMKGDGIFLKYHRTYIYKKLNTYKVLRNKCYFKGETPLF